MDMPVERNCMLKVPILYSLTILSLPIIEVIRKTVKNGYMTIVCWLLKPKLRENCQRIWDKLSFIRLGRRLLHI